MEDSLYIQGSDMRRFLLKLMIFICIIISIDISFGIICDFLKGHARGGHTKQFHDLFNIDCHEILVLGSSRAQHHYDSPMIEEIMKMDCYNAGISGNGVMLAYPILVNMLNRCKPKIIIFEVTKSLDIMINPYDGCNTRYIEKLKPYYRMSAAGDVIRSVSFNDYVMLHSALYRYNSKLISLIIDFIFKRRMNNKGFMPLHGTSCLNTQKMQELGYDPLKLYWLRQFAELKNKYDLKMVWVISPVYFQDLKGYEEYKIAKEIAINHNIRLFDYYLDSEFIGNSELFYDTTHMNEVGARLFSYRVIKDLKEYLNKY